MRVEHAGTIFSFVASLTTRGRSINILFPNGKKRRIVIKPPNNPIVSFCPSIEGEVILCQDSKGDSLYFSTTTGEQLSNAEVAALGNNFYA